ncbi:MAG: lyase family protein, partial [Acidobacteriota bacterium]
MSDKQNQNLWGGRFSGETDQGFAEFNSSFAFDRRLFEVDVRASIAHCDGLVGAEVLTTAESAEIKLALNQILEFGRTRASYFDEFAAEDVHSFVEARLVEMIGDTGRKLHTGRSRNDQVATDLRLWLREEIDRLTSALTGAQEALLDLAEA